MKYVILFFVFCSILVQANNFSEGIRAYKKGDYNKAKIFLEIALAKDKVYNASYILGKMYSSGNGVQIDRDKAIKYFQFAYRYGNIMAGCHASNTYIDKGVYNWGILEDGLIHGLMKKVPYCIRVVHRWQNQF